MKIKTAAEWDVDREALLDSMRQFAAVMKRRPFKNKYGLCGVGAFALYWFLSRINPSVIFEVGIWRGFSTWLIEQAVPAAEVHCFDPVIMLEPVLSKWKVGRTYRSKRAHYSTQDFSCAPIREIAADRSDALAFFDDHQNQLPRLQQCKAAGIKHIVFDDNLKEKYTHRTLEHERAANEARLDAEIESYEVFPALWPVDARMGDLHIREEGIGFPVESEFLDVYRDRNCYSYMTYVRLK
jgi:hypothetical protein